MRNRKLIGLGISAVLALVAARPAAAGEEPAEKRCDEDALACVKYMTEQFEGRGWIGIEMDFADRKTPRIVRVLPGSPAADAGLEPGDVLLSFAGVDYATASEEELRHAKEALLPGSDLVLGLRRGDTERRVTVHAETIPEGVLAQWIGSHLLVYHQHQIAAAGDPAGDE